MQGRTTDENIISISTEANYCAFFCMADFVAYCLLTGKLLPEAQEKLCAMVGKFYDIEHLTPADLIQFLNDGGSDQSEVISPLQWQRILGLVFFDYVYNIPQDQPNESVIASNNMASDAAFIPIAEHLNFNVAFYTKQLDEKEVTPIGLCPASKDSTINEAPSLKVFYEEKHYNRLAMDTCDIVKHTGWDTICEGEPVGNGKTLSAFPDAFQLNQEEKRSIPTDDFKHTVKTKLNQVIQNRLNQAINQPTRQLVKPSSSQSILQEFIQCIARLFCGTSSKNENQLFEDLKVETQESSTNEGVDYTLSQKKTKRVSQLDQIKLDNQYARMLQAKEYEAYYQNDIKPK